MVSFAIDVFGGAKSLYSFENVEVFSLFPQQRISIIYRILILKDYKPILG